MHAHYTEEQLKRAFENGVYAGMRFAEEGEIKLEKLIDTSQSIQKTNVALFLWSEIRWDQVRDWILDKPVLPAITP